MWRRSTVLVVAVLFAGLIGHPVVGKPERSRYIVESQSSSMPARPYATPAGRRCSSFRKCKRWPPFSRSPTRRAPRQRQCAGRRSRPAALHDGAVHPVRDLDGAGRSAGVHGSGCDQGVRHRLGLLRGPRGSRDDGRHGVTGRRCRRVVRGRLRSRDARRRNHRGGEQRDRRRGSLPGREPSHRPSVRK